MPIAQHDHVQTATGFSKALETPLNSTVNQLGQLGQQFYTVQGFGGMK